MERLTAQLASAIANTSFESLPEAVIEKMKLSLLDTVGCALAGKSSPEIGKIGRALCGDTASASGWLMGSRIMYLSAMSHVLEMDDLHKPSKVHPGCIVVPTVLCSGVAAHISGKQALAAMAAGYETIIRLGEAVGTVSHRNRGWHATATCGVFGAAAAASLIMGLERDEITNALGLAGSQAAGLMAFLADGSSGKVYQVSRAAANGWLAARMAQEKLTGPKQVLEAEDGGFLKAFSDICFPEKLSGFGQGCFLSEQTGHKLYACCGHTHQAIYAALSLKQELQLEPEDIEEVIVRTYRMSGSSWTSRERPGNAAEAKFNFPYVVSLALLKDRVSLDDFGPETLQDDGIYKMMQKVRVLFDEAYTSLYPAQWISSVTIQMKDGRKLTKEVVGARGDSQNPLSRQELHGKFRQLAGATMSGTQIDNAIELVEEFEQLQDISELTALLPLKL